MRFFCIAGALERLIADVQHGSVWLGFYISTRVVDNIYHIIFSMFHVFKL